MKRSKVLEEGVMARTIQQRVEFENVSPEELFDIYMNSERHSAAICSGVTIGNKEDSKFTAFDGDVSGKVLLIVPKHMIVQSWRGNIWKETDLDSILILTFSKTSDGALIDLVHANIPEHAYTAVNEEAWNERYWDLWKVYLRQGLEKVP